MQIKNVKVYGLEESIIRSGYPMQVGEPEDLELESDLKYWIYHKGFSDIIDRIDYVPIKSNKTDILWHRKALNEIKLSKENNCAIINLRDNNGKITGEALIDYEDILLLEKYKFSLGNNGYAKNSDGILLHRILINSPSVDHINRNRLDNRRINLRECTSQENNQNRSLAKNNTSNIIGVNYRKDRSSWRAFITYNYKQISLGNYTTFESAIKARLSGELHYFKQNSPQLHLLKEYNIDNPYDIETIEYIPNLYNVYKHYKRICKLSNAKSGSGHDNALKGIIVQFDLQYPEYFSPQLQRYGYVDIVSSQSKMHKITSRKLTKDDFTEHTWMGAIQHVNALVNFYNTPNLSKEQKSLTFKEIISVLPSGYLKWMGISTNYLQLKTIWSQRCKHKHKLNEWRIFGEFIQSLPMQELITNKPLE